MKKKNDQRLLVRLMIGICAGIAFILLSAALLAWMVSAQRVGEGGAGTLNWIMVGVASFLSAWLVCCRAEKNTLLFAVIAPTILLGLAVVTGLFLDGDYHSIAPCVVSAAAGSSVCCLLCTKKGRKSSIKKRSIVNLTKKH